MNVTDNSSLDRRRFMSYFASLGLAGTALPTTLWALAQQEQMRITKDMLANAEAIAGLEFTDEEREMMVEGVNRNLRAYICGRSYQVPVMATFDRQDDREAARISVDSIQAAVKRLAAEEAVDGVFVSCTSLRLSEVARAVEAEVGKPVTSSDHALAWHCLRLAGVDEAMPEFGRLYERPLGRSQASRHQPARPPDQPTPVS